MAIDLKLLSPAESLLWSYGVRQADHIDLEAIANDKGARVVYRRLHGCAARLVRCADCAVISVSSDDSPGRQRFSLGHELAHWICDAKRSSFLCADSDISPQNAEAKSVESNANDFASQLVLPSYLVTPWMRGRKVNLDTAREMATEFGASLTAAAIKLVKRTTAPALVACHGQRGLRWFQKNMAMPFDMFVSRELHADCDAIKMAFGAASGMSRPKKGPANHWLSGPEVFRMTVESQSVKLPDESVLTVVALHGKP